MNRNILASAVMAAGLTLCTPAFAQMGPNGPADPDGDATLTRAEADTRAADRFDRIDANKDGFATPEEMAAARPAGAPPAGDAPAGGPPPGGARRGGPGGGMAAMMMRQADANSDGKISKDEFIAAQGRRFVQMDEDKDGKVTKEERTNFFEDMRARMMMMGRGE